MLEKNKTDYVLDADISGFFNHLNHEWIMKFIGARIQDPNILRLVRRMLKAGIMEDYQLEPTEEGAGQGSVCSPVLCVGVVVRGESQTIHERVLRHRHLC